MAYWGYGGYGYPNYSNYGYGNYGGYPNYSNYGYGNYGNNAYSNYGYGNYANNAYSNYPTWASYGYSSNPYGSSGYYANPYGTWYSDPYAGYSKRRSRRVGRGRRSNWERECKEYGEWIQAEKAAGR